MFRKSCAAADAICSFYIFLLKLKLEVICECLNLWGPLA